MSKLQKTKAELEEMFRYRMAGLPIDGVEVRSDSYGWTVHIKAHPRVLVDMQTRAEIIADRLRQSFDLRQASRQGAGAGVVQGRREDD
jgi:hypothetical protein